MQSRPAAINKSGWTLDLLLLVLLAALAGWLYPMSKTLAGLQDGDGILTSLISTQKLTWYFWGQDRLLNLLPALAYPVTDVEANAHLQISLRAFMSVLAPAGLLALLQKDSRSLFLPTAVAGLLLALSLSSQYALFNLYVQHNPFSTSLVLFGIGAIALRGGWGIGRVLLAVATGFLAYATNFALMTLMVPVLGFLLLLNPESRAYLTRVFAVQLICIVLAYLHAKLFGEAATSFGIHPSWQAVQAAWGIVSTHVHYGWLLAMGLAASAAAVRLRTQEALLVWLLALAMPFAITALSALTWVQMNQFNIRYFLVFILAYCSFCTYLLHACFAGAIKRPLQWLLALGCLAYVFTVTLGGLSPQPREIVSPAWRTQAQTTASVAIQQHANLVVGEFWDTWPVVFFANAKSQDGPPSSSQVYGVTYRGHVLRTQLLERGRHGERLQALCLQDTLDQCAKLTWDHLIQDAHFHIVSQSVRSIPIGKKMGLLYEIAPD
ncbi:hypothetical protein GCM10027082_33170 [Comamonas humi]